MIRRIVPLLERQADGSRAIVNISSIMADLSCPGNAAYTSTKAGLEGLTRALAVELAPRRIRVNSVSPGLIRTFSGINERAGTDPATWPEQDRAFAEYCRDMSDNLQPWPSAGLPEQLAAAVIFLLSPAATFITGADLPVDGAASAVMPLLTDARRLRAGQRLVALQDKLGDKRPGGIDS
jgi:glucose 1-dehydrogenase